MRKLSALALLVILAGAGLASCSSDDKKVTAAASSTVAPAAPTTTKKPTLPKVKDPNCPIANTWSYAYLSVQKPAAGADSAAAIKKLDETAADFKTAVPSLATSIDTRTSLIKKKAAGQQWSDAEKQSDEAAFKAILTWKDPKCG